jgi:hypothetical protein
MIQEVIGWIQGVLYVAVDLRVLVGFIVGYMLRPHILFRR